MQHRLMTDAAVMTARAAPFTARRSNIRNAVTAPAANWRLTFALSAATFVGVFAVVAFVL